MGTPRSGHVVSKPIANHAVLILPFTASSLSDPSCLLPTIYRAVHLADKSLTVVFTSHPNQSSNSPRHNVSGESLYAVMRKEPVLYWVVFQKFLGAVYAILAAAQWRVERVLMQVEVRFEGEDGEWKEKLIDIPDLVLLPEGMSMPFFLQHLKLPTPHTISISDSRNSPDSVPLLTSLLSPSSSSSSSSSSPSSPQPRPVVALGGTFDHLHAAHKLLLQLSLFLTGRKLIVGVMCDRLLKSKSNAQLVQPLEQRISVTCAFLKRCGVTDRDRIQVKVGAKDGQTGVTDVWANVVEIQDPFGPTAWDSDIQALVVSKETLSGGEAVNTHRKENHLPELEIFVIDVISSNIAMAAAQHAKKGGDTRQSQQQLEQRQLGSETQGQASRLTKENLGLGVRFKANVDVEMVYADEDKSHDDDDDDDDETIMDWLGGRDDLESVRTVDLTGEMDEKKLKEMKMGSTAIRQWIVDRNSQP